MNHGLKILNIMKLYNLILIAALGVLVFMTGCTQMSTTPSPTEVFKAQNEARKKKDGAAMKANLSKASVEMIDKAAKAQKKTVEELLTTEMPGVKQPDSFEFRNEKITGDSASVEVKTPDVQEWSIVPFVKEDGRWKVAMDKLIEEMKKKVQEAQQQSAPNPDAAGDANTATDSNPANANTK